MATKYCNNCKGYKESWNDKLGSSYSDNQCWECNKYTLKELIVTKIENVGGTRVLGCNPSTGGYWCKDTYHNADGTVTTTYIQRGNMGPQMIECRIETPPKRSPSPCRIL